MKAMAAEGLTKRFGGLTAVRSVDLAIEAGECRAIIGPNGAGEDDAVPPPQRRRAPDARAASSCTATT